MGKRRLGRKRLYSLNKLGQSANTAPAAGVAGGVTSTVIRSGHEIVTEIAVDLAPSSGVFTAPSLDGHAIAVSSSTGTHSPAYLTKLDFTQTGHVIAVDMMCLEAPVGATANIMLISTGSATATWATDLTTSAGGTTLVDPNSNWALGDFKSWTFGTALASGALPLTGNVSGDDSSWLYLAAGTPLGAGSYSAGKYVIRLYGIAVPTDK